MARANRKRNLCVVLTVLVTLVGAVSSVGTAEQAPVRVKFGTLLTINPVFVGIEKGFFADENIDVEIITFRSGAELVPSLARGLIDVATTAPGGALYNALAQDVDLKIVSRWAALAPGAKGHAMVLSKSLAESGRIQRPQDLTGLTLAITARGQYTHLAAVRFLQAHGMSESDLRIVNMPYPDMIAALDSGAIHVANIAEPHITLAIDKGVGVRWINHADIMPDLTVTVMMYAKRLLVTDRDAGERFMRAVLKSMQYVNDALEDPDKRAEVARIFAEYIPVEDPTSYDRMMWHHFTAQDPRVDRADLVDQLDWYAAQGIIPVRPDLDKYIDDGFIDALESKP